MSEKPVPEKGLPSSWLVFAGCPKCGATVPKVTWQPPGDGIIVTHLHEGDHFHCLCWRCGFGWVADEKGGYR